MNSSLVKQYGSNFWLVIFNFVLKHSLKTASYTKTGAVLWCSTHDGAPSIRE